MTPEGDLKDKVKAYLATLSQIFFWMPVPTGFGVKGIPDFVGCWRGKFFAIETKGPRGKETPWQKLIREKILKAGGISIVAYDMDQVREIFEGKRYG